jgi:hypothetical protein
VILTFKAASLLRRVELMTYDLQSNDPVKMALLHFPKPICCPAEKLGIKVAHKIKIVNQLTLKLGFFWIIEGGSSMWKREAEEQGKSCEKDSTHYCWLSGWRKGPAKKYRRPLEAERHQEVDPTQSQQKKCSPAYPMVLA